MKQRVSYLEIRFVLGLVTLVVGLLAANLALFHWVEQTGFYYLLGNNARYICAYGGFAAMVFGAMLINDFWVQRNVLKGEYLERMLQYAADNELVLIREEKEKKKVIYRGHKNRRKTIAATSLAIFLFMLFPIIASSIVSYTATVVITPQSAWGDYSSELLVNPGGEFGNTTGWAATGPNAANFVAGYDCPAGSAGPHTGSYAFYWNNPSSSSDWAYQEVDLSSWLSEIQAGEAQIMAKGWLVCSEYHVPPWDIVRMKVVFYDNSSQEISSDTYDTGERVDLQDWTEFGIENYTIPTNAVKARIWFQTFENNWDAGNADDFTVKVRTYIN